MKRSRILVNGLLLVATLVSSARSQARSTGAPVSATLDADHARLTAMVGTWDVELTLLPQPTARPIVVKATSTIQPLFGGLFIEEKIEGALMGAPFTTLAWTGFNRGTHQYEATRISSTNTARIAESGTWDESAHHFELKASYVLGNDTWTQRTVIEPTSPITMVATSYLSFGAVPEWKAVEIKYMLRSK